LPSVTAEALSKSSTVGIDVAEIQYAAAKFVFTEVLRALAVVAMDVMPLTRVQVGGSMAPIWQRYFEDCDCVSVAIAVALFITRHVLHCMRVCRPLRAAISGYVACDPRDARRCRPQARARTDLPIQILFIVDVCDASLASNMCERTLGNSA
jgi:hypothetical protein